MIWPVVLIDSCVMMDAVMPFRENHAKALALLKEFADSEVRCLIPSHAYFEYVVTLVVHFKREPAQLSAPMPDPSLGLRLEVVPLTHEYSTTLLDELQLSPLPDLKSQDMIYFCIARNLAATLITQDRKLRNTCRRAGLVAFEPDEALAELKKGN